VALTMRPRLLIVDDNLQFLDAAKDLLEQQGIEVVAVAATSDDAARFVEKFDPDVVLVDVDLGPESGFDLAARLAAERDVPVVLVSAYSETEFADLIAGSAAVGFISKAELSARRIADLLERGRQSAT
jgi:CheY-like chemotaxis protein